MKLGILLTSGHRMLSVAAMADVFGTVNGFGGTDGNDPFFEINLLHLPDHVAVSYPDFVTKPIQSGELFDIILVPAFKHDGLVESLGHNQAWIPWMQNQYEGGAAIASFCTGAFLLASTGLLNDKPATTHIDAENTFSMAFPRVLLKADAVVTEQDRIYTSGGATNSFHLMMRLIEVYCGREAAVKAAKIFSIDLDRKQQTYFGTFSPVENHGDDLVRKAQSEIKRNFKDGSTIEEIIVDVPSSRRNLVRRFKQATGITPIEYLQKTRIEAAKKMLEHTRQSILEVMLESGYNDLKSFRMIFKKNVGMTPTAYRDKFNCELY
jgi:transcriptional regulator GlxA family with amidase domain